MSASRRAPSRIRPTLPALLLTLAMVASALAGCGRSPAPHADAPTPVGGEVAPDTSGPADSAGVGASAPDSASVPDPEAPPPVRYGRYALTGPRALAALRDSLGEDGLSVVLALNRVDLAHARQGDTLVVPEPVDSLTSLAPFPAAVTALDTLPRALLVSLRVQAWGAYERGRLVRWGPTSTGRRAKPTPAGLYHTNWTQKQRVSTVDDSWLLRWYVNLENRQGVSFHEYELPGRPMSHSCVRLRPEDARWIHDWCGTWTLSADGRTVLTEGTPVSVFGAWAWGRRRPWRLLPEEPAACTLAPDEIEEAMRVIRERVTPDFAVADTTALR